ncbi:hypothetical protein RND71_023036 [Anisodus tanguticus]|uniref:Uncharacterized protein n=1 Tax=Anisodus tanguticus TaxID=243964 RepID=A0AAE1RUT7_9SOLA|nr:hypothetical protein RND71_023036 [Anisodus tanguticus]
MVSRDIFSFVVGRAFVTDIEKLKLNRKIRSLEVERVLNIFSEVTKDGIRPGANLLYAIEVLVYGPVDKQSLLDSGILCCLIHILNSLLGPDEGYLRQKVSNDEELLLTEENQDNRNRATGFRGQIFSSMQVEGSVVHIMKALAAHPSAAQSLIEDNSLMLLFQMVANGSLVAFSQYKEGLVPLHTIQLHRHAMQILGLLLGNDNGSTAKYIRTHHLIKVLLLAVKDFNPDCGDSAYTMSMIDLLLECVELSYRPEAGGIRLREDIHNAHGYQFLVQFALVLAKGQNGQNSHFKILPDQGVTSDYPHLANHVGKSDLEEKGGEASSQDVSPTLSRLLDVLVNLAQTGPSGESGLKASKASHVKPSGHGRSRTPSSDRIVDDVWDKDNDKVKDLEAVQMLQDIFLKADSRTLQGEALNRMFKIFSSHLDNYKLYQQLRTVPLLILNMAGFPPSLQEIILKILEYAVTVVNCIPEQELLSLCCLLQQPITPDLKHTILSFFVKLLSFDQQYKKVLREVGVLEVLLEDLKQHKFLCGSEQHADDPNHFERKSNSSSSSFKKHLDSKNAILSSPKLAESDSGKFRLFEVEGTVGVSWECGLIVEESRFDGANLTIGDISDQAHPEELGALVDISESGMITSALGTHYTLHNDAKCDIFGALWRILGVNSSAQRVFGEATGFSLLFTTLHGFQSEGEPTNQTKLHAVISSQTFYDLLSESGLISVDCERQVVQLLLELALEIVSEGATLPNASDEETTGFILLQLEVLNLVDKLARASAYNQEKLTSVVWNISLKQFTPPILSHALKIIEVLGAYRLSASELRVLVRYILQMRMATSGRYLVDMMERLILTEDMASDDVSLAPFVEMNMSKVGSASIQVPLGERSWPPAAGYSFVCWFQFRNLFKSQAEENEASKTGYTKGQGVGGQHHGPHVLRIFSVGAVDSSSLSMLNFVFRRMVFSALQLAILPLCHFQGRLGYSPSPAGKSLQVIVGTPVACARISDLSWKLRSCYLFEEVLSPGSVCFMYILGRGYRGLFQDTDLLQFVPNQACGGGSMAILDSLDADLPLASNPQKPDNAGKPGSVQCDRSGFVWDSDKLGNLSLQLSGKKLIFAFDGTSTELLRASGTFSVLNLVDPMSAAASPIGGDFLFGFLNPDYRQVYHALDDLLGISIFAHCVIGETIRPIGGMAIILALVEAAETRDMLHMALTLLACALHQNPQNIAACEASFSEPKKFYSSQKTLPPAMPINEGSIEDLSLSKFREEFSSDGSHGDMDDFSAPKDSLSYISELENTEMPTETSNCIVLSNADMVEHILLDWTVWVTAPIPIQIALLGFLEHLVSMHCYRNHNLTILRRINLVQHLLVTLQRGDVEVPVLENLVVLLGVILEDGFLPSELE